VAVAAVVIAEGSRNLLNTFYLLVRRIQKKEKL